MILGAHIAFKGGWPGPLPLHPCTRSLGFCLWASSTAPPPGHPSPVCLLHALLSAKTFTPGREVTAFPFLIFIAFQR